MLRGACEFGILVSALSVTFRASQAGAQSAVSGDSRDEDSLRRIEAEKHFKLGFSLGSANQWEAALNEFRLSRAIYPTKSATKNAAIALRRLGRNAQAIELYTALLQELAKELQDAKSEEAKKAAAKEAKAIEAELSATQLHVGSLELRADDGIHLVVDGVQRGVTPLAEAIRLDEGSHTLRLSKDGFESSEVSFSVAGGERQQLNASLKPLVATGSLVIQEAGGLELDAVVDSAVVGKTPWTGQLAPGRHLVTLRGDRDLGTPPSAANVTVNRTTTLTLRAVPLDAALQVEPTPSNASVFLDDLLLGNGIWVGRLPSGPHHVDVVASSYLPSHQDLLQGRNQSAVLKTRLEPDSSNPLWRKPAKHPFYVELNAGALLSASFGGGTDESCGCSARSRPFGGLASLRFGYALDRLGFELAGGYLSISSSSTRTLTATGDPYAPSGFQSTGYHDSTNLRGPFAAIGLSYRMLEQFPITARLGLGLASLSSHTANSGTFSGEVTNPDLPSEKQTVSSRLAANAEATQQFLTPFGSTELRIGYRISKVFSADLGAALMIFFPPSVARAGTNELSSEGSRAATLVPPGSTWSTGTPVRPGVLQLPSENVAGPFVALAPSIAVRARF